MKTLYYPEHTKLEWFNNLIESKTDCTVSDDDGPTATAMGCDGLMCSDCIFSGRNMTVMARNSTLPDTLIKHINT